MAIRDIFKVSRRTFFNPSAWLDLESLREYNATIFNTVRSLFTAPSLGKKETFEEAVKRLKLNDADIKDLAQKYYLYTWIFLILGVFIFLFSFYLLFFHSTFQGWLLGLASSAFLFAQAFRFSFWRFQIKFQKLGCTFEEWKRGKPFDKEPVA